MTGVFAEWQPAYAEHNIPTFPCRPDKRPAVANYGRFGLPASRTLAFCSGADAFGFMCGKRSGVTVLDWDSTDERGFAEALDRHGKTPIIARSASGHFQAWYRHGGERRLIRPRRDVPLDILGGGYVVAPPSQVQRGQYQFLEGSLDDLGNLPTLLDAPAIVPDAPADWGAMRDGQGRNDALFRLLGRAAHNCDDLDQLLTPERKLPIGRAHGRRPRREHG
jgi:Bifunctional DNA primase/polymerase, N-terminal